VSLLPIRRFGDPVLTQRAREVEVFDDGLKRLAQDMLDTMYDAPGVGLAAPQIGMSLRLVVFDDGERGPQAMANPTLSDPAGEQVDEEGCLSVPGLYFEVKRAMAVRADGYDLDGHPLSIEGEALLARILQHEVDHIDGVLYLDRLSKADRRRAMAAIREADLSPARAVSAKPSRTI
jgi:peptide deformylase